jgi:NAD(P)H-dependent flavin oxidoreductase YrpB (nitropropane dioxygenase family)
VALNIKPVVISGKEVHPIIEGGKGIAVSNGESAGAFAAAGAVGTFSGVNADSYDENGNHVLQAKPAANAMTSWWLTASRAVSPRRKWRTTSPAARAAST